MAPSTKNREHKQPKTRVVSRTPGYFFPNEVVRMLSLERLDYRQLRRLFVLAASSRGGVPSRKWARFTFEDLAALRGALAAFGGSEVIAGRRRLPFKRLEDACKRLREDYGLTNPLAQARFAWDGREIVVQLSGARFQPESGQLMLHLSESLAEHLSKYRTKSKDAGTLKRSLAAEKKRVAKYGESVVHDVTAGCIASKLRVR